MKQGCVAIIGAGAVGSTTAHALALRGIVREIIFVDIDETRCAGEILDLTDALSLSKSSCIRKGSFVDAEKADIVIIAAGKRQAIGETRSALLEENKKIISTICSQLQRIQKEAIVMIITNPVDPLTLLAQRLLPLPHSKIFSPGTFLDTQRLKKFLSLLLSIAPQSIHANVLGEHGDTQIVQWSTATIDTIPLTFFPQITESIRHDLELQTKNAVYEIISCKGATFFGIATCTATLCQAIFLDQKLVFPLSCYLQELGVCLSIPVVLGAKGILQYIPLSLSPHEQERFLQSAKTLQQLNFI